MSATERAIRNADRPARRAARGGFSLAELMIALVILGLGLLFIATAIPVGVEYTRRNVEKADAMDAADAAFEVLTNKLRTSDGLVNRSQSGTIPLLGGDPLRIDGLSRPRFRAIDGAPHLDINPYYEPIIKVRPVVMRNINAFATGNAQRAQHVSDPTEAAIYQYIAALGGQLTAATWSPPYPSNATLQPQANQIWSRFERRFSPVPPLPIPSVVGLSSVTYEVDAPVFSGLSSVLQDVSQNPYFAPLAKHPALSALDRFYPPLRTQIPVTPAEFGSNLYPRTNVRNATRQECEQAFDTFISWTAFYRRLSYMEWRVLIPPSSWYGDGVAPVLESNDDTLYELIVVVTRRPTPSHRFPLQDGTNLTSNRRNDIDIFDLPEAATFTAAGAAIGMDRLAPTPWLVTMRSFPSLRLAPANNQSNGDYFVDNFTGKRSFTDSFRGSGVLVFGCSEEVARLCPPGSVLIPARNDYRPSGREGAGTEIQQAGFIPSTNDSLPIYKVVERREPSGNNPDWQLLIENNGFYPWVGWNNADFGNESRVRRLPFWVIPPTFEERDANGEPVYDGRSPVLEVQRRIVRIPKVPDRYIP